jgi:DNA-binding transcriptional regulator YiaG
MPRSTTLTPHNILEIQADLDASLETERQRHQKETVKNSTAIGREIETLRTSAGLSRRQVCKLLGVSYSSLYFIERPSAAAVPSVIKPSNQMRYLEAVSQLAEGTKKVASNISFVKHTGRPKKVLAEA